MNVTRNEIRTGLLVLFALAVFVSVILYLGAPGVFTPMHTYWVYAENAAGIRPGADVMLAGRKVGQVVRLYSPVSPKSRPVLDNDRNLNLEVLMEIHVARSATVYRDAQAHITQYGLLGEMLLDFTNGTERSGAAHNHSSFIAERVPGLDQAARMLVEKLDPAVKQATETLEALEGTANNLNRLTAEGGDVQRTLAQFQRFGSNLNDLTSNDGPLRLSLSNLQALTDPNGKLFSAIENLGALTDDDSSLAKTLRNAEEFTAKLNGSSDLSVALQNFRTISDDLKFTLTTLTPSLDTIALNLEQATDTLKRQPWRLVWPFTKKYPEEKKTQVVDTIVITGATPKPVVRIKKMTRTRTKHRDAEPNRR